MPSPNGPRPESGAEMVGLNVSSRPVTERPLASGRLHSYRCRSRYGWIMIAAMDPEDAMREARRSSLSARPEDLQAWNGEWYVPVVQEVPTDPAKQRRHHSAGQFRQEEPSHE